MPQVALIRTVRLVTTQLFVRHVSSAFTSGRLMVHATNVVRLVLDVLAYKLPCVRTAQMVTTLLLCHCLVKIVEAVFGLLLANLVKEVAHVILF